VWGITARANCVHWENAYQPTVPAILLGKAESIVPPNAYSPVGYNMQLFSMMVVRPESRNACVPSSMAPLAGNLMLLRMGLLKLGCMILVTSLPNVIEITPPLCVVSLDIIVSVVVEVVPLE